MDGLAWTITAACELVSELMSPGEPGACALLLPSRLGGEGLGVRGESVGKIDCIARARRQHPLTPPPSPTGGEGSKKNSLHLQPHSPRGGEGNKATGGVKVRFADEHLVVVEKPAGLTTMRHPEEAAEFGARARRFLPDTLADLLPGLLSR